MTNKKISIEELENLLAMEGGMSRIDFRKIYAVLVLNWHWFLLSMLLCLGGGVAYLYLKEPVYKVSARMLIKGEDKKGNNGQLLSRMEDIGFLTNTNGIENEMEILQSRILLRDVVKDLKLYTEYRKVENVLKPILYGKQPLNVDLDPLHLDSIDRELLTGMNSIRMTLSREGEYYVDKKTLDALQKNLIDLNPDVKDMSFFELPFCNVDDFDYPEIARMIEEDGAKIIWIALGAPKQEQFMSKLLPHLEKGVMIGVGAVFKFFSGTEETRCPNWMRRHHLEFIYRIMQNLRKQLKRCYIGY